MGIRTMERRLLLSCFFKFCIEFNEVTNRLLKSQIWLRRS